ncbi:MAG: anti-anti-sigma factor [Paracoccaceae bacterium]|jgi:anti-anti-sigma factor
MDVNFIKREGFVRLALSGRIDSATAPQFEAALLKQLVEQDNSVLVDLSEVDFVSSAGLRVFLVGAKKIKGLQVSMVLCAMDTNIRKVFAMSGFDRILDIVDTIDAGEAHLSG